MYRKYDRNISRHHPNTRFLCAVANGSYNFFRIRKDFYKLLKIFLRIISFLKILKTFPDPETLSKVRMPIIWLNTQNLVLGLLKISIREDMMEKHREISKNFPGFSGKFPENPGKLIYSKI
jgi:hypothetical protein